MDFFGGHCLKQLPEKRIALFIWRYVDTNDFKPSVLRIFCLLPFFGYLGRFSDWPVEAHSFSHPLSSSHFVSKYPRTHWCKSLPKGGLGSLAP